MTQRTKYLDVTHHIEIEQEADPEVMKKLNEILRRLGLIEKTIQTGDERTMADLSELQREVDETGTVVDSAVVLIGGLADALREAATDPAKVQQLAQQLDAKQQELAQAVDNVPHPEQQ